MTVTRLPFLKARRGIDAGVIVLASLIFISQLLYYLYTQKEPPFTLVDTDCYMRLIRVAHWANTGSWYDNVIPGSNAPFGESLHWSRPLDVLILPGALLFQPLLGFRNSLLFSGILISPILEVLAVLALAWGMASFTNRPQRIRLLMFFAIQPAIFFPFMGGRPDHHSLLALLFIIEIALLARISTTAFRPLYARLLGLTMAMALWVSIEGLVSIAMALTILGSLWAYEKQPRIATATATTFLWLFAGTVLAFLLDRPPSPHFFAFEADRISFQHVLLMGFLAGGTVIMKCVSWDMIDLPRGWPRLALGGGIGIFIILLIYFFIPSLLSSPFSQSNPRALQLWLPNVAEVQPIARPTLESAYFFMLMLGPILICLPWLCGRLWSPKKRGHFICLLTAIGLVFYLPLTFYQMRWGYYSGLLLIFPLNMILTEILGKIQIRYEGIPRLLLRVFITTLFLSGFLLLTSQLDSQNSLLISHPTVSATNISPKNDQRNSTQSQPTLAKMCQWMQQNRDRLPTNPRFLNFIDDGPEILYRTGWQIIATPYHRNGQALVDTYTILSSPPNDPEAMKILRERRPNLILIRTGGAEVSCFYLGKKDCLYQALAHSKPPEWAEKIELPEPLSNQFYFYRIQIP